MSPRQLALLAAIFVVGVLASRRLRSARVPAAQAPQAEDSLALYQDSVLRFRHPRDWTVWQPKPPSGEDRTPNRWADPAVIVPASAPSSERRWVIDPPWAKDEPWGVISIKEGPPPRGLPPLDKVAAGSTTGLRALGQSRPFNPAGGRCLAVPLESPATGCALPDDGRPCGIASMRVFCYGRNGDLFDIRSEFGHRADPARPDLTRRNALIFDRVLASLEFL